MATVVIHHCKLRIVRRHGWAWGAEPQRLLQSAVHILPELLARQLAWLWDDEAQSDITAPVRLTIPVRLSELLAAHEAHTDPDLALDATPLPALHARLVHTLRRALLGDDPLPVEPAPARQPRPLTSQSEPPPLSPEVRWGTAVLRLLLSWREQGVLATRLSFCSLPSLTAWYRSVGTASSAPSSGTTVIPPQALERLLRDVATTLPTLAPDRAAMLRCWLATAVEIVHQCRILPGDKVVQQALQHVFALSVLDGSDAATEPTRPRLTHGSQPAEDGKRSLSTATDHALLMRRVQPPAFSPPAVLYDSEVDIASALPFLLLGPLTRLGYMSTLVAVLEAADILPQLHVFATALAYKVLAPPERGWQRHPSATLAAASFAALAAPESESALAAFAQDVSAHLSPLDAVLTETLTTGHNPQQPLLLYRTAPTEGLLLVDVEGLFPIAWVEGPGHLWPILTRCPGSLLLVPQAAADPQLLGQLHGAQWRFITDAPPTRHERWRALRPPPSGRWWTNDTGTPESQLIKAAQLLADSAEETAILWHALAVQRPIIAGSPYSTLDRSLTLAAAIALGTIAWTLWRDCEPVAPHLTLTRFCDLDARVRFSRDTVRVRLPLGQRYLDLHAYGLLEDVPDVPWFDGRLLQFSGG